MIFLSPVVLANVALASVVTVFAKILAPVMMVNNLDGTAIYLVFGCSNLIASTIMFIQWRRFISTAKSKIYLQASMLATAIFLAITTYQTHSHYFVLWLIPIFVLLRSSGSVSGAVSRTLVQQDHNLKTNAIFSTLTPIVSAILLFISGYVAQQSLSLFMLLCSLFMLLAFVFSLYWPIPKKRAKDYKPPKPSALPRTVKVLFAMNLVHNIGGSILHVLIVPAVIVIACAQFGISKQAIPIVALVSAITIIFTLFRNPQTVTKNSGFWITTFGGSLAGFAILIWGLCAILLTGTEQTHIYIWYLIIALVCFITERIASNVYTIGFFQHLRHLAANGKVYKEYSFAFGSFTSLGSGLFLMLMYFSNVSLSTAINWLIILAGLTMLLNNIAYAVIYKLWLQPPQKGEVAYQPDALTQP